MLGPRQLEIIHLENPDGISHILLGDDGRIRQCLLVLLDNAIKYSFNNVIVIKTNVSYLANGIDVMLHLSVVDRYCTKAQMTFLLHANGLQRKGNS